MIFEICHHLLKAANECQRPSVDWDVVFSNCFIRAVRIDVNSSGVMRTFLRFLLCPLLSVYKRVLNMSSPTNIPSLIKCVKNNRNK